MSVSTGYIYDKPALLGTHLFEVSDKALAITPDSAQHWLIANSGVAYDRNRSGQILQSLDNPTAAFGAYNAAVDDLAAEIGKKLSDDYDKLLHLGISEEDALSTSRNKAVKVFAYELELLNLAHPLATNKEVLYSASTKNGAGIRLAEKPKVPLRRKKATK